MIIRPHDPAAYQLLHEGAIALARMESNGIRVDVAYLTTAITQVAKRIAVLEDRLRASDVWAAMRKRFGQKASLTSRPQLATTLFEVMGYESAGLTASGRHAAGAEALETVDHPFIADFVMVEKLRKLLGTYLMGIKHEVGDDGFLRVFYNLHLAMTYRSSCDNTNIQNQPIRDPLSAKIIRRAYIPRERHRIIEFDYSAIEVRVACTYHHDPTMMQYIVEEYDMHKDMAAECFMLEPHQISKATRHVGKNSFVFPEFYGDVYFSVAMGLWLAMLKNNLRTVGPDCVACGGTSRNSKGGDCGPCKAGKTSISLQDHLRFKGITSLGACDPKATPKSGTFEKQIQSVEKDFWKRRFRVYDRWKHEWYQSYLAQGWFKMHSGFTVSGVLRRNVVINSPVQGAAFHCTLWALIQLQKEMRRRKMRSVLIAEIHDSIIADVHEDEFDDYVELAQRVMTTDLMKHFSWINVPVAVEAEASDVGQSWFEKKAIEL